MTNRSAKRKGSAPSQPPTFNVCSKCFGLIKRGMLPIFFVIASIGWAHPSHQCVRWKKSISNNVELMQPKEEKTLGHILLSALRNFDLIASEISLPNFGKPINVSATTAKNVRTFHTSDDYVNRKSLGVPWSPPYNPFVAFLEWQQLIPEYIAFSRIGKKTFFRIYFVGLISLFVVVPSPGHPLFECFGVLHLALANPTWQWIKI